MRAIKGCVVNADFDFVRQGHILFAHNFCSDFVFVYAIFYDDLGNNKNKNLLKLTNARSTILGL